MAEKDVNPMTNFKLDKVILNVGAVGEDLDKGFILLEKVSGKKPVRVKATKRIPAWNVRPGLEVGAKQKVPAPFPVLDLLDQL